MNRMIGQSIAVLILGVLLCACSSGTTNTGVQQTTGSSGQADASPAIEMSLEERIAEQEVRVVQTKYVVQSDEYKAIYPDMLQAIVENGSQSDVKDIVIAYVAWDKNRLPVLIKADVDFTNGSYVRKVNGKGINLISGGRYGQDKGFSVDSNCNIEYFKAIVYSYEDFDGNTWENPLYDDWCAAYEGVKLKE